jgi:hypothetical protein
LANSSNFWQFYSILISPRTAWLWQLIQHLENKTNAKILKGWAGAPAASIKALPSAARQVQSQMLTITGNRLLT